MKIKVIGELRGVKGEGDGEGSVGVRGVRIISEILRKMILQRREFYD